MALRIHKESFDVGLLTASGSPSSESENDYYNFLKNATIGIFQVGSDGTFLLANPTLVRILGYASVREFIEQDLNIGTHLFTDSRFWLKIRKLLINKQDSVKFKSQWRCKDRRKIVVRLKVWAVRNSSADILYFEGIVEDITSRIKREGDIAKRESYLRALIHIQQQLIRVRGHELPYDDILKRLGAVTHADRILMFENHPHADEHSFASQQAVWHTSNEGRQHHRSAAQSFSYAKDFPRWWNILSKGGSISGLTRDLPKEERKLLAAQRVLAVLVIPFTVNEDFLGCLRFDNCQRPVLWNDAEIELLQSTATAISFAWEEQLSQQRIQQQDTRIEKQQTKIFRQQTEISHQSFDLKQTNRELMRTLEHLKTTQQELIHSEKMAALGHLAAGIAHEINTPLGAIRSSIGQISQLFAQTLEQLPDFFQQLSEERSQDFSALLRIALHKDLRKTLGKRSEMRRSLIHYLEQERIKRPQHTAGILVDMGLYKNVDRFLPLLRERDHLQILNVVDRLSGVNESAQIIETAIERAAKVMFALKMYVRNDNSPNVMVQTNILGRIEAVLTLYYHKLKHHVEVIRHYEELPLIPCYPDELDQIWVNLIHNALQAMDFQGVLTIVTRVETENVVVEIIDTGKGIPEELQPKIFDPFFSTKPAGEGIGLGLEIVRKIVEKHQGQIQVRSNPGNTVFSVSLPLGHSERIVESSS